MPRLRTLHAGARKSCIDPNKQLRDTNVSMIFSVPDKLHAPSEVLVEAFSEKIVRVDRHDVADPLSADILWTTWNADADPVEGTALFVSPTRGRAGALEWELELATLLLGGESIVHWSTTVAQEDTVAEVFHNGIEVIQLQESR
ncbi:MAG: hypothetical protein ABF824_03935 [Acetobacter sp.]